MERPGLFDSRLWLSITYETHHASRVNQRTYCAIPYRTKRTGNVEKNLNANGLLAFEFITALKEVNNFILSDDL